MEINKIIEKALELHLLINGKSKCEIIRMIQTAEGYTPCYGTKNICSNTKCCWHNDCGRMKIYFYNVVE